MFSTEKTAWRRYAARDARAVYRCAVKRPKMVSSGSECHEQFAFTRNIRACCVSDARGVAGEAAPSDLDGAPGENRPELGYEWTRFPEMYAEWEQSFLDYMYPHGPEFFRARNSGRRCGNGRFAYYAAKFGAEVWAIDLGPAVEVARRNTAETETFR